MWLQKFTLICLFITLTSCVDNRSAENDAKVVPSQPTPPARDAEQSGNPKKGWGYSSYVDGVLLQKLCESAANTPNSKMCDMYIMGSVDATAYSYEVANDTDWLCGEPKPQDLVNATLGFLRAHPDLTTRAAGAIVPQAVYEAFGCNSSSR